GPFAVSLAASDRFGDGALTAVVALSPSLADAGAAPLASTTASAAKAHRPVLFTLSDKALFDTRRPFTPGNRLTRSARLSTAPRPGSCRWASCRSAFFRWASCRRRRFDRRAAGAACRQQRRRSPWPALRSLRLHLRSEFSPRDFSLQSTRRS